MALPQSIKKLPETGFSGFGLPLQEVKCLAGVIKLFALMQDRIGDILENIIKKPSSGFNFRSLYRKRELLSRESSLRIPDIIFHAFMGSFKPKPFVKLFGSRALFICCELDNHCIVCFRKVYSSIHHPLLSCDEKTGMQASNWGDA